jgi:hypothetical protein
MRRREFITLLGVAAAWPLAARAQQSDRMRRIAVLMNNAEDDPEGETRATAFRQGLQALGWAEGKNLSIHWHWTAGDVGRINSRLEKRRQDTENQLEQLDHREARLLRVLPANKIGEIWQHGGDVTLDIPTT